MQRRVASSISIGSACLAFVNSGPQILYLWQLPGQLNERWVVRQWPKDRHELMQCTCPRCFKALIEQKRSARYWPLADRFSAGWYFGRLAALVASSTLLVVLLSESMKLYARLLRANLTLEHERKNRLMNVKAAASSIAHEVRQPLAAITAYASTARRWLQKEPPEFGELKPLLDKIEYAGFRAGEVLTNVPKLFEDADHERQPIDLNDLALQTLEILRGELNYHAVKTDIKLASELPPVMGHRVQLREVILNLVRNAIDAMDSVKADRRALRVSTKPAGETAIIMEIEDSGPGIESEHLERIFEAFVTTKIHGTGLGLTICATIVELHGGRLTASSDGKTGALFQIFLPVEPALIKFAPQ